MANVALDILFIGNSFTQRNDLPGLLAAMAQECGVHARHSLISAGGASLRTHWNAGKAAKAIKSSKYDWVVLQEQSTLPVKNAKRMAENVRLFDAVINESGAKTALYMTWARQFAQETQKSITTAYNAISREIEAVVIPVGSAWEKFFSTHEEPSLYDRDQSHPSLAGSYFAACVFLATLLRINPVGISAGPAGLKESDRKILQSAAWKHSRPRRKGSPE